MVAVLRRVAPVLFFSTVLVCMNCSRSDSVRLDVDFSSRPQWQYGFSMDVVGTQRSKEPFAATLTGRVEGIPDTAELQDLAVSLDSIHLTASFLDTPEIDNITAQFTGMKARLSLRQGMLVPEDSNSVPVVGIGAWDLYRCFCRVVPSLPANPVRPGFAWDRERHFPLVTKQGDAVGHLYQSFVFDSLRTSPDNIRIAYLRWKFSYSIEPRAKFVFGADSIPLQGDGTGEALIDVDHHIVLSANAAFVTQPGSSVMWNESVKLYIISQKE